MRFFSTEIDASGWPLVFWILTKTEPSPVSGFQVFQGFSRFFSAFSIFLWFFNVFQGVSGFVTLNYDEGPPPRPFHSLVLVKQGSYFSILKAK